MKNILNTIKSFVTASPFETALVAMVLVSVMYFSLPIDADAINGLENNKSVALEVAAMENETLPYGTLPKSDLRGPSYTVTVEMSAYTSRPQETDDSPYITASNTHVRFGVVATNFLPIGTRIKIPEIYGDQVFIVEDRMNARYWKNVDIWMEDLTEAKQFGRRDVTIEVYTATR